MGFDRIVAESDYCFYVGGRKIDDLRQMARFRDSKVAYLTSPGGWVYRSWKEPKGSDFGRIHFPDREHFQLLWDKGGETKFDAVPLPGIMKLHCSEYPYTRWNDALVKMLRYDINAIYNSSGGIMFADYCFWGNFVSDRVFVMKWTQARWNRVRASDGKPEAEEINSFSNEIDVSKLGLMGPEDTLVFRHYTICFRC